MRVMFFEVERGNFGDDLNRFFWDDVLPGHESVAPDTTIWGIGTLFSNAFIKDESRILVLGSGAGYDPPPDVRDANKWDIRAVRGPKTAELLGLPPDRAVADAAILLPRLVRFADIEKTDEIVFVPHWQSLPQLDWTSACEAAGVAFQAPSGPCEHVVRRIAGARAVIAESMHAAIIADAFGVPWTNVRIGQKFNDFKWEDWAASLDIGLAEPQRFFRKAWARANFQLELHRYLPRLVPKPGGVRTTGEGRHRLVKQATRDLKRTVRAASFYTSDRALLRERQDQLEKVFEGVRCDYGLI